MGKLTFILGGARSGKSTYAEQLAKENGGKVLYIATAEGLDPEMRKRIENHRLQRPAEWDTMEVTQGVGAAFAAYSSGVDLVLLDCMTLLVSNVMLSITDAESDIDEELASDVVDVEVESLLAAIKENEADWVIVSNEVGLGLVPPYPLGRLYRDLLGWANRKIAAQADEVYLLVAGIPMPLHQWRG